MASILLSSKRRNPNENIFDVPREQRLAARPTLEKLFAKEEISSLDRRNERIAEAFELHGYTLREIGEFLVLNPDYLSRINKNYEEGQKAGVDPLDV